MTCLSPAWRDQFSGRPAASGASTAFRRFFLACRNAIFSCAFCFRLISFCRFLKLCGLRFTMILLSPTAVGVSTTPPPAKLSAPRLGPGPVDPELAVHPLFAVEHEDRLFRLRGGGHLDKGESLGLTCVSVSDDVDR